MVILHKISGNLTISALLLVNLLIITGISAYSQGFMVSGKIEDIVSGMPIPDATLYINGTSKGTITGLDGGFKLSEVVLPCELIISHVSYELKKIPLQDASSLENLWFGLDQKLVILEEVTVIHERLRKEYLRRFKTWFLGRDYEKYNADIINDSVLIFSIYNNEQFSVYANEPIIVDLPATGYSLKVDLVKFDLQYEEELWGYHCSILGFYYFNPIDPETHRQQRIIARNRTEHYYNSIMHFCRSLYHNSLAENGYVFERDCFREEHESSESEFKPDFIASYGSDPYGNQQLLLTQFACKKFRITFNYNARNRPVDLTYLDSNPTRLEWSGLRFLSDSIHIYPSGRIPDNSILFSKSISRKGVASMLPEDYIPSMQ